MRNRIKENSNRGGALLSVIIAMTVVGILGALVLSNSYTNFQMKQIDKKSKDNFYSAESVLDEIFVGLQEEVSKQYKKAYTNIMENYGNYTTAEEMSNHFKTEFVLSMVEALQESPSKPDHYDLNKIRSYVTPANYPSTDTYTVESVILATVDDGHGNLINTYGNGLETLTDGLCLRNIVVTYTNKGYVNTIKTDIKVNTPQIEFARISTIPEITDYCLIAQDGMKVQGSAYWNLKGKAFAGSGIALANGSHLYANDALATMLITEGDISVQGNTVFQTAATTSLWAQNIKATGGNNGINLLGRTYVKDDTTLNGLRNKLTLGGQYYGYSSSDNVAADSSAIIINDAYTELNMSTLESLVLAGTAFVSTKASATETDANKIAINTADVLMGDSIAVKGNQIAYLLPTECKGIVTNPMSYTQYEKLITNENWKADALNTVVSTLHRSLASYGGVSVQPVFTAREGGTVYLYISFSDAEVAGQYFMDYYGTEAGEKIKSYVDSYVSKFTFNTTDISRLVTMGNYLVPRSADKATYTNSTSNVASTTQELNNYLNSYEALCAKLIENKSSLTSEELSRTVYYNLIDQNVSASGNLDLFFAACGANTAGLWSDNVKYSTAGGMEVMTIWANAADMTNAGAVRCILVDNDDPGDAAYNIPAGGRGIIIATGSVVLPPTASDAWKGLIICNGNATLYGGSSTNMISVCADADAVFQALQYVCSVGTTEVSEATPDNNYSVISFFIGGGDISVGASSNAEGARVDVRECLSYENWKSE